MICKDIIDYDYYENIKYLSLIDFVSDNFGDLCHILIR